MRLPSQQARIGIVLWITAGLVLFPTVQAFSASDTEVTVGDANPFSGNKQN